MNEILAVGLNVFLIVVEVSMLFLVADSFFEKKSSIPWMLLCYGLLLAGTLLFCITIQNPTIRFCFTTAWTALVYKMSCRAPVLLCVLVSAVATALFIVSDSVVLAVLSLFVDNIYDDPYLYYLCAFLAKTMELLLLMILRLAIRKRRIQVAATTWHDWARVMMFPVISAVIGTLLLQAFRASGSAAIAPQFLACSVVLILMDFLAIIFLDYLDQQQVKLREYAVMSVSMKAAHDGVTAWMNVYENQRRQTHDYQNHLIAISGLLAEEAPEGNAMQYVQNLMHQDKPDALFIKTGRAAVDALMSQKQAIARAKAIDLQLQLDNVADIRIPDDALITVLSNLLDNAIEACEQIPEGREKRILLKTSLHENGCFIYSENTTAHPVKIIGNHIVTTKRGNAMEHGFGLRNMDYILKKYDADYVLDYDAEKSLFCFSAQIPH